VTITKDTEYLTLAAVSVSMDCDSPLLPWDATDQIPATMNLHEILSVEIPLATTIEEHVGVDVCG